MLPAIIPAVASVAGSVMDMISQRGANETNAQNVQKQIDFQREQSATTWQRGVADMKAAGLNPALAYQQGGNPASTGAAATAQPITQNSPSKFATAASVYNELATGTAQRDLLREQATATGAQARLTENQAAVIRPEAILGRDDTYVSENFKTRMAERWRQQQEHGNYPELFKAEMGQIGANTARLQAAAALDRRQTTLTEQSLQNEWFRKNIAPYLNSTSATLKTAGDAISIFKPWTAKPISRNYDEETTRDYESGITFKRRTYQP